MDIKLLLVIIVLFSFAGTAVDADIYFDRLLPRLKDAKKYGYKCVPGRSYIIVGGTRNSESNEADSSSSEEDGRRTHMNSGIKNETCQICVCSLDGTEKHCSGRPARNVNECMRIAQIEKEEQMGVPYDLERVLAYRIRRDYVWHYDEIPYDTKAKCQRGLTYYSNNPIANDTDIDVQTDLESLIAYNTTDICYYCVCAVDGNYAGCINRDPWYCQYYRFLRDPNYTRQRYAKYFRQDRAAYFRTLSYRMRRRIDDGVYSLLDFGGDALCCDHPNGHRRNLHSQMRNKIRQMKLKVPKENILVGSPHGDYVDFIVNND